MSIRTTELLYDALAGDLIWRKKELSVYKLLTESAHPHSERRRALLRGAVALLYAHWEGFIKTAGEAYLEFVYYQRLRYNELSSPFLALAARQLLKAGSEATRIRAHIAVTDFFRKGLNERGIIPYKDAIATRANLSSSVLRDIMDTLGLDYGEFEAKEKLIDERLLAHRNDIAHGEYLLVTLDAYEQMSLQVVEMMESFSTQVANAAILRQYRSAA